MENTQRDQTLDQEFFEALVRRDVARLETLVAADFTLADLTGGLLTKSDFLKTLTSGDLRFVSILPKEFGIRFYGDIGVVNGRTTMSIEFKGAPLQFESRYTHVYATTSDGRQLVAAQGTPIQPSPNEPAKT